MGANKTAAPLQHRVDRRRERLTPLAETIRLAARQDEQTQQTTDPVDHGSPNARERWHRVATPRCFTHGLAPTCRGKNTLRHRRLLRTRCERPRGRRDADQRDELAPPCMPGKEHCEG